MKNLRHPAKPFCRNELDLNATIASDGDSEEEDYPRKHSFQLFIVESDLPRSTTMSPFYSYSLAPTVESGLGP